jgi:hypothetical protein
MDPVTAMVMGGGALLSGLGGYFGSKGQAQGNQQAAMQSAMMQQEGLRQMQAMYAQAMGNLSPYMSQGAKTFGKLGGYLEGGANAIGGGGNSLISNFAPTIEQLESTPGYQFIRDQGLKTVQNSMAAKGLGLSGNAIKAGVDYAEGLANTTWKDMLDSYLRQNQQAYEMLMGPSQVGAGAAGTGAGLTGNAMNSIGQMYGNIGNTLAGGTMGAANARAGGLNALTGGLGSGAMIAAQGFGGFNPLNSGGWGSGMPGFSMTEMSPWG